MIPTIPSTIVATVYCLVLACLSTLQFYRSRTPLRLGAAVMAVFGLSISALSIVYATQRVSLSIFWVYQFVAECVSLTWVITTIIHLGYAFYPLTRHQTFIWRTALGSVLLYDAVAIAELSYYCYAVFGSGSLPREATPVLWIYWVRQLVKVLACAVTVTYLFVPLVRHHHNAGVAMIADSNTLAVGTWYLSSLGVTCLGYLSMFVYYMTKSSQVFTPQAQSLDLCIRLIACPIFSLPPPRILLVYFQEKYGSAARDDNPNTMLEEGITNNPRPRRPVMLVNNSTSHSTRRNSDYIFDEPTGHFSTLYPTDEQEDVSFKSLAKVEPSLSTSDDDSAERGQSQSHSQRTLPIAGQSSELHKEAIVSETSGSNILNALSIPNPSAAFEQPRLVRKFSRRTAHERQPSLTWHTGLAAFTNNPLIDSTSAETNIPASSSFKHTQRGQPDHTASGERSDKLGMNSGSSILEETERTTNPSPPRMQGHPPHEGLPEITSSIQLESIRATSRNAIRSAHGDANSAHQGSDSTTGPLSTGLLRKIRDHHPHAASEELRGTKLEAQNEPHLGPLAPSGLVHVL